MGKSTASYLCVCLFVFGMDLLSWIDCWSCWSILMDDLIRAIPDQKVYTCYCWWNSGDRLSHFVNGIGLKLGREGGAQGLCSSLFKSCDRGGRSYKHYPTHKGRKLWKFSNFHLLITSFTRPLASQITITIWDCHLLIDIFKCSCGYLPVNSLQSPSTFPHSLCHHELDVFLSKIQLRNGRNSHYAYNCGPWCCSPNFF